MNTAGSIGQDLETRCPKLVIVKFLGILFFKGDQFFKGYFDYNHKHVFITIQSLK